MASVFLSHSHSDKPLARKLAADLRKAGHAVWIDEAEIKIGDSLIEKIRDGIDQVDFVAAILSKASSQSGWVQRELDIASNREIKEKKVVVLPLLAEDVTLPGFLEGKFYGDFREEAKYDESLALLIKSLGPAQPVQSPDADELAALREELAQARQFSRLHETSARRAGEAAFKSKSRELQAAIEKANIKFPNHAPINRTYAFQIDNIFVTLDYALWAISKSTRKGSHPLEALLTLEDKWPEINNMLEAYGDMIKQ